MKVGLLCMLSTPCKYLISFLALAIISSCFDVSVLAHRSDSRELKSVKVGLVASLSDRWGKMGYHFVNMAISDFYEQHPNYKTRLHLQSPRDSQNEALISATNVEDLIKNEQVIAIIGPETSQEAQFAIRLGERSHVPIISYSASSPLLSSRYFIQVTQDDLSLVRAITAIIQAFGLREVTPVYVNNEFGGGIIPYLVDALQQIGTRIPAYRCVISSSASDDQIAKELSKLRDRQTRVFVVHMEVTLASRLFSQAKNHGLMSSDYVWIVTSNIANNLASLDHEAIESMQGVLGVKTYIPKCKEEFRSFKLRWMRSYEEANGLDLSNLAMSSYGLWAYDATFMLAEAVEHFRDSSFTFTGVISDVGPRLIQSLHNTSFRGLSGNFSIVNGKLQTSRFDIINVIGTRENNIGLWTQKDGLVKNLEDAVGTSASYSTTKENLGPIIWPGHSTVIPRGRVLRIGVPKKVGFTEFVKLSTDSSNQTVASGFCIDVFEAARKILPYDLHVQYIEANSSSYDNLATLVYSNKEYDAVVGDVTITAERSLGVDFTLPYMESDVWMVVHGVKDNNANQTWAFLRPLSLRLWVTSLCFFIMIAVVIWVNEYQINDDFRAESGRAQIGLCLFYSFSTMVFSNKEQLKSNLSRAVMGLWVFTLLLLTQSYTASLASMLTVRKLQPAYKDVDELLRSGSKVGYQDGAFVLSYLLGIGFNRSKILAYRTVEEMNDLLSNGTKGGGIDAVFEETPFIKLFLARHCNKYMKVTPPVFRAGGLGFVFPIGSPLVSNISRAMLNVTEGEQMDVIWNRWLNNSEDCPMDPSTTSLDLDSFVVLFAVTGATALAAVVWKLASFFYENRQVWQLRSGGMSWKMTFQELSRSFHTKKVTSPAGSVVELENSIPNRGSVGAAVELASIPYPSPPQPLRRLMAPSS